MADMAPACSWDTQVKTNESPGRSLFVLFLAFLMVAALTTSKKQPDIGSHPYPVGDIPFEKATPG